TPTGMSAKDLVLITPTSQLNSDIVLKYEEGGLSDFENKVNIEAKIEESSISLTDLNTFYDGFGNGNAEIALQGNLVGTLNDLGLEDFKFDGMDHSAIHGELRLKGLFSDMENQFSISGNLDELSSDYN